VTEGRPIHIKIFPELRAEHVDLSAHLHPCEVYYFEEKYDLGESVVPPQFFKKSTWGAVRGLIRSKAEILEVPEPLWVRVLPRTLVLVAMWRLGGLVTGRKRRVVTYALENNDLEHIIGGAHKAPAWLVAVVARLLGWVVTLAYDRIAYGSDGARELYAKLQFGERIEETTVLELPQPTAASASAGGASPSGFVFLGRLEARKGVLQLMRAWEAVEANTSTVSLTIMGDGPLMPAVVDWASERPERRLVVGWVDHAHVLEFVARSTILVAPSVPEGRWREQIGLPIEEGLSQGLTIVTTDQTGLAAWLRETGHFVIPVGVVDSELAPTMVEALANPLDRTAVRNSLNSVGGRQLADTWLHREFGKRREAL